MDDQVSLDPFDRLRSHLSGFFTLLVELDSMTSFLNVIQTIISTKDGAMSRFPEYFTTFARYYSLTHEILCNLIRDSLEEITEPAHMFRSDHVRVRVLKEFTSQTLAHTLISFLKPLVATLDTDMLSEVGIIEHTTDMIERLCQFRFPLEFKSCYVTMRSEERRVGKEC